MHLPLHLPLQSEHTHACPSPSLYPYPSGCLDRSLLCARRVDVVPLRLQVHRRTLRLRLLRLPSAAAAAAAAAAATLGPHVVEAARRPLGTGRDAAWRGWLRRRDTPATRLVRGRRICTWYTGYGLRRGDAKARGGMGSTAAHYLRDRARTRSVLPGEDARELHRAEALHRALHLVRVRTRVGVRVEVMVGVRARARTKARVGIRMRELAVPRSPH